MLGALTLLIFSLADAVQSVPRGSAALTGVVQDQTGAVLPGARVTLLVDGTATPSQEGVTDTAGSFHFDRMASGNYILRVEFPGFTPHQSRVRVGRSAATTKIVMAIEGVTQEVSVTDGGRATVQSAGNLNAIAVDAESIENLPILDQDVVGAVSRFLDASVIGTGGATVLVDGVEVSSLRLPASAIQQIKINQNPYAAEFMRPGRGRIEVITKPGGGELSGTFNLRFRDSDFNARNAFATTKPPEQRRTVEGTVGGPVPGSKKANFLAAYQYSAEDNQAILFAETLAGPVRGNLSTPARDFELSGTLNRMQGEKHLQSMRVAYAREGQPNQGVGGTSLPELASNYRDHEVTATFGQQTVFSPRLLNELRVLVGDEVERRASLSSAPRIVVADAFSGGGAQSDWVRTERHFTLVEAVTWSAGKHTVKFGLNIPDWSWRGLDDRSNVGGTFAFSSLADYAAGRPYSFTQQTGDGHVAFVEKVVAGFVQDEIRLRSDLSVDVGLRYDWQSAFGDGNNFAPRFSFAYAPGDRRRTVIRGGAGLFYDRTGPGPILDLIRYDGQHVSRYVLVDPGYPNALLPGQSLDAQPFSLVQLAPDTVIPMTLQYSVGIERQLAAKTTLSVNLIRSRSFDTFRSRDVNAPLPPLYAVRPDPARSVVRQIESVGRQETTSLQLTLRGQMTRFFNGSAEYSFGRAHNDTSGIGWMPPNSYDLSLEYARADFNQRHRLEMFGSLAPGKKINVGLTASLASGRPYSLTTGRDLFNTGSGNARPAGVPRNSLTGFGHATVDVRLSRELVLSSGPRRRTLTPAVDAFNVLNRVNYSSVVGNLSSPYFGQPISAQAARRLQFSLRVRY